MATKSEFKEWRDQTLTRALYKEMEDLANIDASKLLTRKIPDQDEDTWLRGRLNALGDVSGWEPEYTPEEDPNAS